MCAGILLSRACVAAHPRKSLSILLELDLKAFDLRSKLAVFVVGRLRHLFKVFDLGFEVLEMLLLALSESSLCCSILCLAFLKELVRDI